VGDVHPPFEARRFEPGGDVDVVAEDVELHPLLADDARHDPTGVNPRPHLHGMIVAPVEIVQKFQDLQGRPDCLGGMVGIDRRGPEDDHIGVADGLDLGSPATGDKIVETLEEFVDEIDEGLAGHPFGQAREAGDVEKEDGAVEGAWGVMALVFDLLGHGGGQGVPEQVGDPFFQRDVFPDQLLQEAPLQAGIPKGGLRFEKI